MTPALAVDSFKNTYLRNYRAEVGAMYKTDKARMEGEGEMPPWYGQTYSLVTFVEEGRSAMVMNASANYFVDMGGAHPNQWSQWLNFDANTGKPNEVYFVGRSKIVQQDKDIIADKIRITMEPKDFQAEGNVRTIIHNIDTSEHENL